MDKGKAPFLAVRGFAGFQLGNQAVVWFSGKSSQHLYPALPRSM